MKCQRCHETGTIIKFLCDSKGENAILCDEHFKSIIKDFFSLVDDKYIEGINVSGYSFSSNRIESLLNEGEVTVRSNKKKKIQFDCTLVIHKVIVDCFLDSNNSVKKNYQIIIGAKHGLQSQIVFTFYDYEYSASNILLFNRDGKQIGDIENFSDESWIIEEFKSKLQEGTAEGIATFMMKQQEVLPEFQHAMIEKYFEEEEDYDTFLDAQISLINKKRSKNKV